SARASRRCSPWSSRSAARRRPRPLPARARGGTGGRRRRPPAPRPAAWTGPRARGTGPEPRSRVPRFDPRISFGMGAAEALIQTALLGEAVDGGPALIFVADEEMRYLAVNQRACDVLGYTRDELLELNVTDVAREPTSPAEYDEMLARSLRH